MKTVEPMMAEKEGLMVSWVVEKNLRKRKRIMMGIHVPSNVPMESTPFNGMEFEADEIAYDFYNEYGRKTGFSIRKEYVNKCKKTGVVTSRRFVCAKEGVRGKDKRDQNIKNPRAETRCGCEARLVIILNRDSKKYVVNEFIAEHNHYLHLPSTVHMMPSQRKVAATHAIEIDLAHESGLRLKQSYELLTCTYEYDGEDEFLTAWNEMLNKYDVRENKWLINLFKLKEKWAQAYVKRTFTAGMKTTRLSESFNADLKDCLCTDLNITEVEEVMTLSILERNVSQTHSYVVGVFNQNQKYEVMWNPLDETLSCSCRKFESFGILCRHGLKILDVLDIKLIPNRYIMKRWRRDAKDGSGKNCTTHNIKPDTRLEYVDRYRDLCPKYIQLVNEAYKEDQLCASITIVPKGIKKREIYRNKKRRTKSWIEKMPKRKEGTSKKQTKKRKVQEEIYAHDIMAQKKTDDISSGNITNFTQLLMSASTSSAIHQGSSSASVALASHLESISSVVGSNDKINGAGGLLTQGSVASGGPLTQESATSGWNPMVHKVKLFF
ncbi:hypothetical protein SO802_000344 [Lithocarpus litseifolius]|uniref:SWIM-type domain-containing protein n=1 Tax=Lithocarpus litseifolius TaxID=425828 RepID=A0AAW2DRB8_9ROSI